MTRFQLSQDVMPALALGPRSCMIGRAYARARGEAGVAKALHIPAKEMLTTMGLCGVNTIAEIKSDADGSIFELSMPFGGRCQVSEPRWSDEGRWIAFAALFRTSVRPPTVAAMAAWW
jgi:FMN-dependent dehydrogenase